MKSFHIFSTVIAHLLLLNNCPAPAQEHAAGQQPVTLSTTNTLASDHSGTDPDSAGVRTIGPIVNCWYAVSPDRALRGYAFQGPTARSYILPNHAKMQRTVEELAAALLACYHGGLVLRPYYDGNRAEKTVRPLSAAEIQRLSELLPSARVEMQGPSDR